MSNCATQTSTHSYSLQPCVQQLEAGGRWTHRHTDNRQSDRKADTPSLLIPVYSKWKPAADTLMSVWKVRYRLLEVLFSSWGIVVPLSYNIQKTVKTMFIYPYSGFNPSKMMWACNAENIYCTLVIRSIDYNLDTEITLL